MILYNNDNNKNKNNNNNNNDNNNNNNLYLKRATQSNGKDIMYKGIMPYFDIFIHVYG